MRLRDILCLQEGVNDNFLYHSTDVDMAIQILDQNRIEDRTSHAESLRLRLDRLGVRPSEVQSGETTAWREGTKWITGVSLTRSLPFARSWKKVGVVLALDARALRSRHRLIPMTYYARHQENTPSMPEAEEFLLGPLKDVKRYLSAIYISKFTLDAIRNSTFPFEREEPEDYADLLNDPRLVVHGGKWEFDGKMVTEAAMPSLKAVEDLARRLNVDLEIEAEDRMIRLIWIDRYLSGGEAGSGSTVLQALCDFADARRSTITLAAKDGDPRLIKFYERFGFEMDGDPDDADPVMIRVPKRG